jgi:hypothetical protein
MTKSLCSVLQLMMAQLMIRPSTWSRQQGKARQGKAVQREQGQVGGVFYPPPLPPSPSQVPRHTRRMQARHVALVPQYFGRAC